MRVFCCARILTLLLVSAVALHASASADIVSGTWHWETDGGNRQITMTLKADGGKLTGTVEMGDEILKHHTYPNPPTLQKGSITFKIDKGVVSGSHFTFLLNDAIQWQRNLPTTFTGDVNGDEVHAFETRTLGGKEIHKVPFSMKRVQAK